MTEPRRPWVTRREVLLFLVLAMPVFLLVGLLDTTVYQWSEAYKTKDHDLTRLFRVMGYLPLWFIAAVALWQVERVARRALLLAGAPTACGVLGEVLKLVIGRVRPRLAGGEHFWRPLSEFEWNNSGLSTPSSHAIIAFGAAWMLGRLFPRARLVWLGLATGCAVTRVLQGSHFVSDVYLSAIVSLGVVTLLWRWQGRASA